MKLWGSKPWEKTLKYWGPGHESFPLLSLTSPTLEAPKRQRKFRTRLLYLRDHLTTPHIQNTNTSPNRKRSYGLT